MSVGVSDLTAIKALDLQPPTVRAPKAKESPSAFDRALDRQRQAAEKPAADSAAKADDAQKPAAAKPKDDGKKVGASKKSVTRLVEVGLSG